jgi:hypothetical protein
VNAIALEPACGAGHIAKLLNGGDVLATDLIYRGYGGGSMDFFFEDYKGILSEPFATVIANPPFNLFQEFAERALKIATKKVILFGKLQALESVRRSTFMRKSPLRTVYVFKSRQNPLRNGMPTDENGKPWASTIAFAWFVWEKGYEGKPTIEWI